MAKTIFRKIGGRIVPIKIRGEKNPASTSSGYISRSIRAKTEDQFVGKLNVGIPKKGKYIDVESIAVEKKFRRRGIAHQMMKYLEKIAGKSGKRFLRSDDLQSTSMVNIRKKLGKTRFFADQFGPYGEETRRISASQAKKFIRQNKTPESTGRLITATTMLKKKRKK